MEKSFTPTLFISVGNEKELSKKLKEMALDAFSISKDSLYTDENGKPLIKNSSPVGISVTHDENIVAVLIAPFEPLGIDIEKIKNSYSSRIPERFFTKKEQASICSCDDFYKIWCRKESYLKMTGEGIGGISHTDTFSKKIVYTDLSDEISKILNDKFAFMICSHQPVKPKIIVI